MNDDPVYEVLGRRCATYREARALAEVFAERNRARVALMEKPDTVSPWHVLEWVKPEVVC